MLGEGGTSIVVEFRVLLLKVSKSSFLASQYGIRRCQGRRRSKDEDVHGRFKRGFFASPWVKESLNAAVSRRVSSVHMYLFCSGVSLAK